MKITRREWAGALAAGAASAAANAQAAPETPEELRKAASDRLRRNVAAIQKQQVPMATEPAFSFRA